MTLTINGENREFASVSTVADLISQLGMKADRVAIELNRDLLPRDRWSSTQLSDGDKLEIVHFVGGGTSDTGDMKGKPSISSNPNLIVSSVVTW